MKNIRKFLATCLLIIVGSCAFSPAPAASPGEIFYGPDGTVVRLGDGACTEPKVLSQIKPEYRSAFKRAATVVDGVGYSACWFQVPDGSLVFVVDEDGNTGDISSFKSGAI